MTNTVNNSKSSNSNSSRDFSSACENTYFPTQLAIELGSTELAIVIQFFINVISKHKRMGRNLIDGYTWNYCTKEELVEYFPFWTEKMIRTRVENLVKLGLIKTANYNKNKYDRTLWYAFVDESKWGLDKIQVICPNGQMGSPDRANGKDQTGRPIPPTKHRPKHDANQVIEGEHENAPKVVESASPSVTRSVKRKGSLFKGKVKYTEEQEASFDWLKSLELDTSEETLSWWSRNYSLTRLDSVYRESIKRNPKSLGAYMQKLLKKGATVITGRVELNAEFAKVLKDIHGWSNLEIHQKYAIIKDGNKEIEIDFNMECDEFKKYIMKKQETFK